MKKRFLNFVQDYNELVAFVVFLIILLISKILDCWQLYAFGFILFLQFIGIMRVYDTCCGRAYYAKKSEGNYFPSNQECNPKYFKILFKLAHFNINRVPTVAVQQMYTAVITSIVIDTVFLSAYILNPEGIIIPFLVILYLLLFLGIIIFFGVKANKASFIWKFKKVSWRNIGYLLRRMIFTNASSKEPSLVMLGKCKIIAVRIRRKNIYVDVKMHTSGSVYKNVLLLNEKYTYSNAVLKEISGIKYID